MENPYDVVIMNPAVLRKIQAGGSLGLFTDIESLHMYIKYAERFVRFRCEIESYEVALERIHRVILSDVILEHETEDSN